MKFDQLLYLCLVVSPIAALLLVSQPRENVWETLANASGLDTICLTHSKPGKPFSTFGRCASGNVADSRQHPSKISSVRFKSGGWMGCLDQISP